MITRLLFVRHGQSGHHVEGLTGGWTDTPLTELGRDQVRATADYLAGLRFDSGIALVCSDLQRAAQSADIIGERLGLVPRQEPGLREINGGAATGLTLAEAERIALFPETERNLDTRRWPGAETYREMFLRMQATCEHLAAMASQILVVGHGLSGQALITNWLGIPAESPVAFHLDPASLSEMRVNRWHERELSYLNRTFG